MNENEVKDSCGCGCGCGEEHTHEHGHDDCGCGCGCGDHEHEPMMVDLEDENGNTISCEVVDGFVYNDNEFVLVQNPENESVYLFKVEGEEGQLVIPEDDEFDAASKYYESIVENN